MPTGNVSRLEMPAGLPVSEPAWGANKLSRQPTDLLSSSVVCGWGKTDSQNEVKSHENIGYFGGTAGPGSIGAEPRPGSGLRAAGERNGPGCVGTAGAVLARRPGVAWATLWAALLVLTAMGASAILWHRRGRRCARHAHYGGGGGGRAPASGSRPLLVLGGPVPESRLLGLLLTRLCEPVTAPRDFGNRSLAICGKERQRPCFAAEPAALDRFMRHRP
jgi:hypothetical protein